MSEQRKDFKKVAVLGAGVMGAQIAAHLVNAKVPCILFDLPAKEGNKNGIVEKAVSFLTKLQPSPFSVQGNAALIQPANYDENLPLLKDCDLIIEAISERMDWKKDLYHKIAPHLRSDTILASNTSGLSITELAGVLPDQLRAGYCGIHFFNPPRYMPLVELIPHTGTNPQLLDQLETFLVSTLGKGVVRAKDTPNFIANRVGVFSMLSTMKRAEEFGLGFDTVDALTGPLIGRAKSATYRTADVVGLDTLAHVVGTMKQTLPNDAWAPHYEVPAWLSELVKKGALGQKTKQGIYKKEVKNILVFDVQAQDYRPSTKDVPEEVLAALKLKNPQEKLEKLRQIDKPEARFLWSIFSDIFHYSAVNLEEIAFSTRDLDFSMRWGYGWTAGPFELWQSAGWSQVAAWVNEDIEAKRALSEAPLPPWVHLVKDVVHTNDGSYSPAEKSFIPRPQLPVYMRQAYPDPLLGEQPNLGHTLYENSGVRLWTTGDDIGILSFKSKMHAIGNDVLEGCLESLELAAQKLRGCVIWQMTAPFSAGANLQQFTEAMAAGKVNVVSDMVKKFQLVSQALKYSRVPTVSAPQGLALGGGCEFLMHSQIVVAALETYIGLVEVGVGLLPAGGGCKEFAHRAALAAENPGQIIAKLKQGFENMAMGKVSKSAEEARELGYLKPQDVVIFNAHETLHVAKQTVQFLSESGYRPPLQNARFPVAGAPGIATLEMMLVNMLEGQFISEHEYLIGKKMATVLCGGAVDEGTVVDEQWLLDLEHQYFMELAETAKTQERVVHMLKNGKPLRN